MALGWTPLPTVAHHLLIAKVPMRGLHPVWMTRPSSSLELHRAQVTDRRVSAFRVVEAHKVLPLCATTTNAGSGALG